MEAQIDSLKHLRQDALRTSIKLKKTIISQTDELINLLKERQHELVFNVDELCQQQIWLCQDLLHKYQCSQTEDIDVSKYLLTDQISNLSRDILMYEANFEELKSAIKSFGKMSKGPQPKKQIYMDPPLFDLEKSRETQVFIPSKQCSLSSNCSGASKTSLDSFEVIETIEACALQKHENLDDSAYKNPSMNATHIPDSTKHPLKIKMIADWLHKTDNVDEECTIVTNMSNDQNPPNKACNIMAPLQTIDSIESVSHATKSMEEHSVKSVTSNNQTIHKNSLPFSRKKATLGESPTSSTKNDFKEWLNDSKRKVETILIEPCFDIVRDDLKKWLDRLDPKEYEQLQKQFKIVDPKGAEKLINTPPCNMNSSPAKAIEQSFSPYFVKDDPEEWLCSKMCV